MTIPRPLRYRVCGWGYSKDRLASTLFEIQLDAKYAKKILSFRSKEINPEDFQRRMLDLCRNGIDKYATMTFFEGSMLIRTFSVTGNCCCMGIDGSECEPNKWRSTIAYKGHNNDSINQAYHLLWIFNFWLETVEAFIDSEEDLDH